MDLKSLVRQSAPKQFGPRPAFSEVDVLRALWLLSERPVGRKALADALSLGEGSMRSLLAFFSRRRLVESSPAGCSLTRQGLKWRESLGKEVRSTCWIQASPITFNMPAFCVCVKAAASKPGKGIEQRDAAVREGAFGATILCRTSKGFVFPGTSEKAGAADSAVLLEKSRPMEGDALVLCYASNKAASERGAWAAALTLF
jgi:hypothetical protein